MVSGKEGTQMWPKRSSSQKPLTWPLPFLHFRWWDPGSFSPVNNITFCLLNNRAMLKASGAELGLGSAHPGSQEHRGKLTHIRDSWCVWRGWVQGHRKRQAHLLGPITLLCLCVFVCCSLTRYCM